MVIKSVKVDNFMLFEHADISFSPNVNIISGANSSGKTALIKLLYSCSKEISNFARISDGKSPKVRSLDGISKKEYGNSIPDKIAAVYGNKGIISIQDLIRNNSESPLSVSIVYDNDNELSFTISKAPFGYSLMENYTPPESDSIIYLPPKEMISSTETFASLYEEYDIPFDETYYDLVRHLNKPRKKSIPDDLIGILKKIEEIIDGTVQKENNHFYLNTSSSGKIRMGLVAEGYRKMATLYNLIETGALSNGAILFWDEPETNINPTMVESLVEIILALCKSGVQVFMTTHDYFIQQYFGIAAEYPESYGGEKMSFKFLALKNNRGSVEVESKDQLYELDHNPIKEEFDAVYDKEQSLIYGSDSN